MTRASGEHKRKITMLEGLFMFNVKKHKQDTLHCEAQDVLACFGNSTEINGALYEFMVLKCTMAW